MKAKIPGRGVIRASERIVREEQDFKFHVIFELLLNYKSIIKMNLTFLAFIQETIFVKQRMGYM